MDLPEVVVISGSTGLIGTALRAELAARGVTAVALVRPTTKGAPADAVGWDPGSGTLDGEALAAAVGERPWAAVHLAGAGIASGRWNEKVKHRVLESRERGTAVLAQALAAAPHPPRVLVCGSAVGFYGERGDEALTEESGPGGGFVAEVVRRWEAATAPAQEAGIQVAHARSGLVLSRHGGLLPRMTLPVRLGLVGRMGTGRQWMSWISIDDEVGALLRLLEGDVTGPVNLTAPHPVTNRQFLQAVGRVLRRPTVVPVPATAFRLALGRQMADETVLISQQVLPRRLEAIGYGFRHPELEPALRAVLERW